MITSTHILFWHGIFSNWYPVDGNDWTTSEKIFMIEKAKIFSDLKAVGKIALCKHPRECKAEGRKIKNYTDEVWFEHRMDAMLTALWWKVGACEEFKEALIDSGDRILVEASPADSIWGIGYNELTAMSNQESWGLNLLGKALMETRERLL